MFPKMRTQKDSTTGGDVPLVCLRGEYLTLLRSYSQPTSTQVCASSLSTGGSSGLAITCKKLSQNTSCSKKMSTQIMLLNSYMMVPKNMPIFTEMCIKQSWWLLPYWTSRMCSAQHFYVAIFVCLVVTTIFKWSRKASTDNVLILSYYMLISEEILLHPWLKINVG